MKYGKNVAYLLLVTLIIILDRMTKVMALEYLVHPMRITSFLEFNLAFNRGITWGMFHSARPDFFWIITIAIVCMIVVLSWYTWMRYLHKQYVFAEVAVLAGAYSNLIDRLLYGGVIDFIHLSYGRWSWPIFNVADVAIVLGIALMIYHYND